MNQKPIIIRSELDALIAEGLASAESAINRFEQPNYVVGKICEEAGEVAGAYIKRAEGRGSDTHFHQEVVQLLGLIFRLYFEGDETITANAPDLSKNGRDR